MCSQGCPGLSFTAGSLHPRGLCAEAGTLPPARVSTQPAQGAPHGAVERSCGWKERPLAGQGPSAVERVLHGSGLLTAPDHPTTLAEPAFQEESQGRGYLKDEDLSRVCDLSFLLRERGKEMSSLNKSLRVLNCYTEGSAHLPKPPKVPSPTPLPTGSTSITFACSISAYLP